LSNNAEQRRFDLVVWGASGFTGRLVSRYLAEQYPAPGVLSWAIGGRDAGRLEALRAELGSAFKDLPILIGDSTDRASLDRIVQQAGVVCSTVGPFARFGSELVAACAAAGTDYCDITGEAQWIRNMIDQYETTARRTGARIVNSCGFDSIPSDFGVLFLQNAMIAATGEPCAQIKYRLRAARGGASGGTAASLVYAIQQARDDRTAARALAHPYGLNPIESPSGPDGRGVTGPQYDPDTQSWIAPFVMAVINEKIVRRTNAISGYRYGKAFRYGEAVITGRGLGGWLKAMGMSAGLAALLLSARYRASRWVLQRFVLPGSGKGPSPEEQARGFFNIVLIGHGPTPQAPILRARVTAQRDPGYGATARMLGESAVCLAKDDIKKAGGFWTPVAAMGETLLRRLQDNAELSFVIETESASGQRPMDTPDASIGGEPPQGD
jgi:short subunit dehydrogenase-like uncharacterized protein